MSEENIDKEDSTFMEYEKIIGDLMNENATLKKQVAELEEQIKLYKESQVTILESPKTEVHYDLNIPRLQEEMKVSRSIISPDTSPLEMGKGPIVEGMSRRECPICGNTNKTQIHETIDRTHIISAYPRMYGKKYKCGSCGREWRLPLEI